MQERTNHTCRYTGRKRTGVSLPLTIGSSPAHVILAIACRQAFCKVRTRTGSTITNRCLSSVSVTTSLQEGISRSIANSKTRILIQEVSDIRVVMPESGIVVERHKYLCSAPSTDFMFSNRELMFLHRKYMSLHQKYVSLHWKHNISRFKDTYFF